MKLGIVGNGMIAKEVLTFIDELDFEAIYICGRKTSEKKIQDLVDKYKLTKAYFDYTEFLKADVDLVYIALPNDMHYEYAVQSIKAGKHTMVEKPIVTSRQELEELWALAKENNVFLFEAMSIYHMPAFAQLKKDLALVGNVRIVNFNYSQLSSRYLRFTEGDIAPVFDPKHFGGALRDLNLYNISTMVGLFGKPKYVTYSPNIVNNIDVSGVLLADYGDFSAVCIGAKDCSAPGPSTIQGDAATICIYPHVNGLHEYDVVFNDRDTDTKEVDMSDGSHRLFFEFKDIMSIIENNDSKEVERLIELSLATMDVIDQAIAATK